MDNLASLVSCTYCGYFPTDPVESNCCGGIYCWSCAVNVRECESCKEKLNPEMYHPARAVKNLISKLQSSGKIESNLNGGESKPNLYKESSMKIETSPAPKSYTCPEGCGASDMNGVQVADHLQNECPKIQMPCKNVGCKVMCSRFDLEKHVDQCELKVIDCPYGCGLILKKDYDTHKKLNTEQHLDQLLKIVETQKNEIKELKKHPAAAFDEACPEAFPKRVILLILFMICIFMPFVIKLPIFVLCFVRVYQVLFYPYIIERGTVLLTQRGFSLMAKRVFSAICHLVFIWQCAILVRAF